MAQLNLVADLDREGCTGCNWCDIACPSGAITMSERKAYITDERCIGCGYCVDRCPEDVMWMTKRDEPLKVPVTLPLDEQVQADALALLEKARVEPTAPLCPCSGSLSLPAAAAIVMGAKTLEDVSAMTGIRGGCKIYCVAPTLRMLKAAGYEVENKKGFRIYDHDLAMVDLEGSELDGEEGSWLKEDLDVFALRRNACQKDHEGGRS